MMQSEVALINRLAVEKEEKKKKQHKKMLLTSFFLSHNKNKSNRERNFYFSLFFPPLQLHMMKFKLMRGKQKRRPVKLGKKENLSVHSFTFSLPACH